MHAKPRRLDPEARRRQIIQIARQLFAERGRDVSTADVAAAAQITRALVHHYFPGIDALRDAVAMEIAESAATMLARAPDRAIEQRVRHNVNAFLDAVEANRYAWLTTVGADGGSQTPAGRTLRKAILERMLANNADTIEDTPWARLCLTGYMGFTDAVLRHWILEHGSRAEAQEALTETLLHLLTHTIPTGGHTARPSPRSPHPGAH